MRQFPKHGIILKEKTAITPAQLIDSVPLSLYEAECDDMNIEESGLLDVIVGIKNVLWWHRIIDRKAKLTLGRQWQVCAGQEQTRFFMVFKKWNLGLDGANTVEEFAELLREL